MTMANLDAVTFRCERTQRWDQSWTCTYRRPTKFVNMRFEGIVDSSSVSIGAVKEHDLRRQPAKPFRQWTGHESQYQVLHSTTSSVTRLAATGKVRPPSCNALVSCEQVPY